MPKKICDSPHSRVRLVDTKQMESLDWRGFLPPNPGEQSTPICQEGEEEIMERSCLVAKIGLIEPEFCVPRRKDFRRADSGEASPQLW
jgi:hypothetical protein